MGRMFGFTLDMFSHIGSVTGLGLQPLLRDNYRLFAADNYANFNRCELEHSMLLLLHFLNCGSWLCSEQPAL